MRKDYYPFGMMMPGRTYTAGTGYRYGFNGKENDNDVKGEGNQQDYGMRIYDTRLGKFLSVDPLTKDYPWYTPYQFAGNKPIWAIDLDGTEEYYKHINGKNVPFAYEHTKAPSGESKKWEVLDQNRAGSIDGNWNVTDMRILDENGDHYFVTKHERLTTVQTSWGALQELQIKWYYSTQAPRLKSDPKEYGAVKILPFISYEQTQVYQRRKFNDQFALAVTSTVAVGPGLILVGPSAISGIGRSLFSLNGFTAATWKLELSRRSGAALADALVQAAQIAIDKQDKFNFGATIGSFATSNPLGGAAWNTAGQVYNKSKDVSTPEGIVYNFILNAGGNFLGDKMGRGILLNSPRSTMRSSSANFGWSLLGNLSGNSASTLVNEYQQLNAAANDQTEQK